MSKADLIDRRTAIDALIEHFKRNTTVAIRAKLTVEGVPSAQPERDTGYSDGFADGYIAGQKEAQPEQQWISCKDRLPEANGRYLATRGLNACGAMWNRVYIINYSDLMGIKSERIWWDGNVGKSDFQKINDVIAWCELPEPWRGEEHGQDD